MRFRYAIPSMLMAALPALALASEPAKPAPAETFHRVELKPPQGAALPYTIEVPADWQVRQVEGFPGLWIGPDEAKPPEDPRLIWVRGSQVSLANPEQIAANIKANDAKETDWSAPRVEVKELAGVRGVLVRMDSGEPGKERSSLILKLPLEKVAADFVISADRAEFERRLPLYERILFSVQPAVAK